MRPMSRSINLSNAVAIVAYEAWRQLGFAGQDPQRRRS
jgi:tRNA (cytidine/uridine-2'-O-)-methyltransferase